MKKRIVERRQPHNVPLDHKTRMMLRKAYRLMREPDKMLYVPLVGQGGIEWIRKQPKSRRDAASSDA